MDADIAIMQQQLRSARAQSTPATKSPSIVSERAAIHELLHAAAAVTTTSLRHTPPTSFTPGKPLRIAIAADRDSPLEPARLFHRHVNQAEEYTSVPLTGRNGALQALIPGTHTPRHTRCSMFVECATAAIGVPFRAHRRARQQPYSVVTAQVVHRAQRASWKRSKECSATSIAARSARGGRLTIQVHFCTRSRRSARSVFRSSAATMRSPASTGQAK